MNFIERFFGQKPQEDAEKPHVVVDRSEEVVHRLSQNIAQNGPKNV